MSGRLAGKVALITGAASGIGLATAKLFESEGARVRATDLREKGALKLDVTLEEDWEAALAHLQAEFGPPDILVANAGISFGKPVTETSLADWRRVMAVNLDGVFLGTKHCVRAMRSCKGGSIVIVSSASGIKASPGASAYCASKAALRLFAKSVALECIEHGDNIRVNTVAPSGVITPMWQSMDFWAGLVEQHGGEEGAWRSLGALPGKSPLKRFATTDEVARGILYLASDESSFVTGTELVIDGGYTS